MKWLKRWIHSAVHEYHTNAEGGDLPDNRINKVRPATSVHDVLGHMANSIAQIYRIDNGFIVTVNMNSDNFTGNRGACVYAKDATELAEKIIAHETAFKIGVRGNGGLSREVQGGPATAFLKPGPHAQRLIDEYKPFKKGDFINV